jgi:hypothetical protein
MNSTPLTELDICYNIRYVELHGRNRKDPWSFRNLALYHSYSRAGESTWIFISLPVSIREHLKQFLDENEDYHHVLWHLDILISTEKNWRWYINFLEDSQQNIVSLVLNTWIVLKINITIHFQSRDVAASKFGSSNPEDFPINFSSSQTLSALQARLQKTLCILHSHIGTLKSILLHTRSLQKELCLEVHVAELLEAGLQQQIGISEGHIRRVEGLLQSGTFMTHMVGNYNPQEESLERNIAEEVQDISTLELSK